MNARTTPAPAARLRAFLRKADALLVAVVLVLAVAALALGPWLIAEPAISLSRDISPLNPRLFPSLVLVGIVCVAVAFIVNRVRGADAGDIQSEDVVGARDPSGFRRLLGFLVLVVTAALLLDTLGFLTTMFMLMFLTALLVGNESIPQILSISIGLPLVIYVLVTHVLRTALPELDVIETVLAPLFALLPSF